MDGNILNSLNKSQKAAVTSDPHGQLSILAGPGSGKTHTLVARIAWLLSNGTLPWNILVTTFTVKTAREMKERIEKLVGASKSSKLILGTFHSIARRYLTQYGHLIGLKNNFDIADSVDSLAIIKRIVKKYELNADPKVVRNRISGIKARGGNRDQKWMKKLPLSIESQEFDLCYREYEEALHRSDLFDYDDLLLNCVKLIREHPICVSNIEAVLIDEFQDTNTVQFDLMRLFAACKQQVTIVGDPDQSIYSFRAAELQNYQRFQHQYPKSTTITLEENYRSSGAIISTALNVIKQDSGRISKSLVPTNNIGTRPVIRKLLDAHKEAEWISLEIQRVIGMTGGLLDLSDFSILLRSAALSRLIENSLRKTGLAYRMVGGVRFYDRVEVRILLDYLRAVNQPNNDDALSNILNVPPRRIGDTTIRKLIEEASNQKITLWSLILMIAKEKKHTNMKLTQQVIQGLSCLCDIIETSRTKIFNLDNPLSLSDLLKHILDQTNYEEWLHVYHNDILKLRWSNVEELVTQVMEFQENIADGYEDESLPLIAGVPQKGSINVLAKFLANVALSSGIENNDGEVQTPQITISTIHAAKGLEWPVVFIPAVYQGSIPHLRSDDSKEERRLLYVAMTRAKVLLYLSYPLKSSRGEKTALSEFISLRSLAPAIIPVGPVIRSEVVHSISQILRRPNPTAEGIASSSSLLPSKFDNLFPADAENNRNDTEMQSYNMSAKRDVDMAYQDQKRRCIEPKELNFHLKESNSTFISDKHDSDHMNCSFKSSFISASSHLENLSNSMDKLQDKKSQGTKELKRKDRLHFSPNSRLSTTKLRQSNLKVYFGKSNLEMDDTSTGIRLCGTRDNLELNVQPPLTESSIQKLSEPLPLVKLGNEGYYHKSVSLVDLTHVSCETQNLSTENRKSVFNVPDKSSMTATGLTRENPVKSRKTLGVKRSMAGWSSRKEFVPPSLSKENHSSQT
ncbi:ATP-dependent DNA helicase srs2 [Erysiphe neolycopersici]|uniref:DNA 3'-5' helicase n=1 Tax=Erysiphe neolycopersici TaxID=212602 RepID=A0A420HTZ8_9PEZI|nr:ATP-dependent DNA helicase srs2 [Erysiphe neolycopersici]